MLQINSNQKIWPPISNPDLIDSSQDTREIREVRQEPGRGRGRWRPAVGGQRGPSWDDDQLSHTRIPKSWIWKIITQVTVAWIDPGEQEYFGVLHHKLVSNIYFSQAIAPPWPRHGPAIEAFEAPLPSGWSEHLDPEGRVYFFSQVGMVGGCAGYETVDETLGTPFFSRWSRVVASCGIFGSEIDQEVMFETWL